MNKVILPILVVIFFNSCAWLDQNKKSPIPGKRLSVLTSNRSIIPDAKLNKTPIVLPMPSTNISWPQAGGYANHAMHHVEIRESLERKWSVSIGEGNDDEYRLSSEPIVVEGKVFTMDSESVVTAFSFKNGSKIWNLNLTPESEDDGHIGGGIAYEQGTLYVTTGFAKVFAIQAKTGKQVWNKKLEVPLRAPPTVRGGRVFVITLKNELIALNSATGDELWRHSGLPETASILGGASAAVDAGIVIAPYSSGQLVALRVDSGRVLWEENLSSLRKAESVSTNSGIRGRPIIDRGLVVAISNGGQIIAVDLRTGKRIWTRSVGSLESPWIAGNYIFAITNQAEVVCLSRQTGEVFWVQSLEQYEDPINLETSILWTGPILASDRLIVAGSNGKALAISPYTGRILGQIKMPDKVSIPPVVANGNVFFLANDAELVAYH